MQLDVDEMVEKISRAFNFVVADCDNYEQFLLVSAVVYSMPFRVNGMGKDKVIESANMIFNDAAFDSICNAIDVIDRNKSEAH